MGTPEFAVPTLNALIAAGYPLVGVVTQPDRPAGRGRAVQPSPVKQAALARNIPVFTPKSLKKPEAAAFLVDLQPDLIVVAAFGMILRPHVLDLPRYGCINVHASLLPRHRGAAPISAAILLGDAETGVTIMVMDEGLDTGDMLSKRSLPIRPDDTTGTLTERLAEIGGDLLVKTLAGYLAGTLKPMPQTDFGATYAPMLKKEDGLLNFHRPADFLARKVRAMLPWPGAYCYRDGQVLKIITATAIPGDEPEGEVVRVGKAIAVGAGHGLLRLDEIQPSGKKPMPATAYANGDPSFVGTVLTGATDGNRH